MTISYDPRIPGIPADVAKNIPWLHTFRERFYDLWRELTQLVGERLGIIENYHYQGGDVASATAINVGPWGRVRVTGSVTIDRINARNNAFPVVLHFTAITTVRNNQAASGDEKPIVLAAGVDLTTAALMQVTLQYDLTDSKWYQI